MSPILLSDRCPGRRRDSIGLLALLMLLSGCGETWAQSERVATSAAAAVKAPGYLEPAERPDSVALLPPPPARGSAESRSDEDIYRRLSALAGTARWQLATADADLKFPHAANVFACALGFNVDPTRTPHLYTLLQRTIIDAGQSTYPAKLKYGTNRPFEDTGQPTCVRADESGLRDNPSYPSGHASLGYVWGEVLAQVVPDRAAALRARGYEFGQSRVVCRVHWQSDVDAGRVVGQAVMPRLQQDSEFQADLAAARIEAQQARKHPVAPVRDCDTEAAALSAATAPTAARP
ncbi:MAG: acid phosphatase [Steroidobacteraceae bacterium]